MLGSMYVSDPTVWRSFYENMIEGKFNPGQYRGRQRGGGGIAGMYSKKPYMIPVNPHATQEPEEKVIVGKQVSPVTAVEERAKSDIKDAIQDNKPHIPISIKGTNTIKTVSVNPAAAKAASTQKKRKKKYQEDEFTIFNKKSRKLNHGLS